jgi:hypothetical protein
MEKEDALAPLLKRSDLKIWSHLVTDAQTADRVLDPSLSSDSS